MKTSLFAAPLCVFLLWINACSKPEPITQDPFQKNTIRGADLSFLPQIESAGTTFYNLQGQPEEVLTTLKNAGCNTVRIRLWKTPQSALSGFAEVQQFAQRIKSRGMKVWLSVHYSDTWADPGRQDTPEDWKNLDLPALKDSLREYTRTIVSQIRPDYFQIGNEINAGFLWPQGNISHQSVFLDLLQTASRAIRQTDPNCQIILHYAGLSGSDWFFNSTKNIDYDIIGLSYYPNWHGKDLPTLQTTQKNLISVFRKDIVIAETAYPFTLEWKDWTNNIIGTEDQLISEYPATPGGQARFLAEIHRISTEPARGIGFCYWGGEWIAYKGNQATDGSPWENQAFYDFSNKALPVLNSFSPR